jgi:peptidyl-prolyl cis-trans isomerase C
MNQKCFMRSALLAVLLMPLAGLAADASGKSIAKVNGVNIPHSRFDIVAKNQISQGQEDSPQFREDLREVLITREVLAQEALKRKLDKDPAYTAQMDVMRQQILLGVLFEDFIKNNEPTEAAMRTEYDKVKGENEKAGRKEYLSRHILLKDEPTAKAVIAQLQGGGDFAAIAREKSVDPGSADKGGELGWSEPDRFVGPYGDTLKTLKKGEYTKQPVQTQFGFHVIQVLDERAIPFPEYDTVKDQIRQSLLGKARDDYIGDLRAKAKIEKIGSVTAADGEKK